MQTKTKRNKNSNQNAEVKRTKKINAKELSKILFLPEIFILFFLYSATFICLLLAIVLTVFSVTDCSIKSKFPKSVFKKIINNKFNQLDIDFDSIFIDKTPIKKMALTLQIKNLKITHRQSNIKIVDFDNFDVLIPVKKMLFGSIIPVIDKIENKKILLPYSLINNRSKQDFKQQFKSKKIAIINDINKNKRKIEQNDTHENKLSLINKYIELTVSKFTSLIHNAQLFLINGLEIKNVQFLFFENNSNNIMSNIKIINSKTKVVQISELDDRQNQNLFKLIKKINNIEQSKNNLITNDSIKNNSFFIKNFYENAVIHSSKIEIQNILFTLDGICNTKNGTIETCLFKISGLPIDIISSFLKQKKISFAEADGAVDGEFFVKIKNNNIDIASFDTEIAIQKPLSYKNIKIDIDKVSLSIKAKNNFKKIENIKISAFSKNRKKFGEIYVDDFYFLHQKPNCKITANIFNLALSDLIHITDINNNYKNNDKDRALIDGVVDGAIFFEIKNGNIVASNKRSRIGLKKIAFFNEKKITMNNSFFDNLLFTIKILDNEILLNSNTDDNSKIDISFNKKTDILNVKLKNFFLKKNDFNNFKNLFFQKKNAKLIKDIEYDMKLNGSFQIPTKIKKITNFTKKSFFDLNAVISKTNIDHKNDIFFEIKKKLEVPYGIIKIDFGSLTTDDKMYNNFVKNENDKSIIFNKFIFDNNNIKLNGKWNLNNKEIMKFDARIGGEGNDGSYMHLYSDNLNLNVDYSDLKNITIKATGENVFIDKNLWHIILFLANINTENNVNLKIKADKCVIHEVKLKKLDINARITKLYVDGYIKGFAENKDGFYNDFLFENQKNNFSIKADDMSFILDLLNINNNVRFFSINANGVKKGNQTTGIINVNIDYNDNDFLQFNKIKIMWTNNFIWNSDIIQMIDTNFYAKWFDVIGDLKISKESLFTFNGKIKIFLPFDKFKYMFVKKPAITKNDGFDISKIGHSIDEFSKNLTINNVDFSLDENGKSKTPLLPTLMKMT